MEHTVRINLIGAVSTLVIGVGASVVASTVLATRAYRARVNQLERADQAVTVKGYARTPIHSDHAVWSIRVSGRGTTLPEAFAELDRGVTRAAAFLAGQGFKPETIALSAITTDEHPVYDERGRATMDIRGYTMTRTIIVDTADVERVASAASSVTELLKEGVAVLSQAPEYTCSSLAEAKVELVGLASADARGRAAAIAAQTSSKLAETRNALQGVMQVTTPGSTRVSSSGIYDTTTIEKDASLVVTVTFGLEHDG